MSATTFPAGTKANPLWRQAWFQVLIGAVAGAVIGAVWPNVGIALKPCADAFIALIKLSIPPLIFLVIVTGVARVGDLRKVGRLGLKTLIYFEVVSTIGLLLGALVGNVVDFGSAVQRPSTEQAASALAY